jgi:hypothetical protein
MPALLNKLFDTYTLFAWSCAASTILTARCGNWPSTRRPARMPAAFWQHLSERINQACKQVEKMRALLPSDMRIK